MSEERSFEDSCKVWLEMLSDYIDVNLNNIDGRVVEMISEVILTEFLQMGETVRDFHEKRANGEIPPEQLLVIRPEKVKEMNIDLRPFIPFLLFNNIWKDNLRDMGEETFKHNGKYYPIDIPVLMNSDTIITQVNKKKKEHKEGDHDSEKREIITVNDLVFPQSLDMIANSLGSIQRKKDVEDMLDVEVPNREQNVTNHYSNLISQPYMRDLKRVLYMDFVSLTTENTLKCLNELLDKMEMEKPHLSEDDLFYSNLLYNCLQSLYCYVDEMIYHYGEESVDIDFICQFVHINNMYLIITKVWKYGELEELTSFFGFAHPSFIKESIKHH